MTTLPQDLAIRVEGVSKRYEQGRRISLRHEAGEMLRALFQANAPSFSPNGFWALRDVSFEVRRGETVGIIGRNGSGKTTLLKLLAGITAPTMGQVEIYGRAASLLSLNAGFSMERSGRDNINLNAALCGATPRDVRLHLDNIIEFAELGEFIDRPVKLYSSGMLARLGFSIAIHILPEIILIDEVLSVGDAAFQAKCMERIVGLKSRDRTLVLVSHSEETIRMLCRRAIWLDGGRVLINGPTESVLAAYKNAYTALGGLGDGTANS